MKKETKDALHAYIKAINVLMEEIVDREFVFHPSAWNDLQKVSVALVKVVDSEPETIQTVPQQPPTPPAP